MKKIIAIVFSFILLFDILVELSSCSNQQAKQKDIKYNNGICAKCETPFHLVNVTYKMYEGYKYIYACENDHVIICSCEQEKNISKTS